MRSADTNFVMTLHGIFQLDSRTYFDDGGIKGNDGFVLRRLRPIFEGTVFRDFNFRLQPDFGGSGPPTIRDAYLNYQRNIRTTLDFLHTDFQGGEKGEVSRQDEKVFLTRVQLAF